METLLSEPRARHATRVPDLLLRGSKRWEVQPISQQNQPWTCLRHSKWSNEAMIRTKVQLQLEQSGVVESSVLAEWFLQQAWNWHFVTFVTLVWDLVGLCEIAPYSCTVATVGHSSRCETPVTEANGEKVEKFLSNLLGQGNTIHQDELCDKFLQIISYSKFTLCQAC